MATIAKIFKNRHKHSVNSSKLDTLVSEIENVPVKQIRIIPKGEKKRQVSSLESLKQQLEELQVRLLSQNEYVEEEQRKSTQVREDAQVSKAVNSCLQVEIDTLENRITNLERDLIDRTHQVTSLEFTAALNAGKINAQQDEIQGLHEHINRYKQWGTAVKQTHTLQQNKIQSLQSELQWALSQAGEPVVQAYKDTRELLDTIEGLQQETATKTTAFDSLKESWQKRFEQLEQSATQELKQLKDSSENEISRLEESEKARMSQLESLEAEAVDSKSKVTALQVGTHDLKTEVESLEKANTALLDFLGAGLSARKVLLLEMIRAEFPLSDTPVDTAAQAFITAPSLHTLTRTALDVNLETEKAQVFRENLSHSFENRTISDQLLTRKCAICETTRFTTLDNAMTELRFINEYPSPFSQTACCSNSICSFCLPSILLKSIKQDWWNDLDCQQWLRCPVSTCTSFAPIRHVGELTRLLSSIPEARSETIACYERAMVLRTALQNLSPRPSADALSVAARLHEQLAKRGHVSDFFDSIFPPTNFDPDTGRTRGFEPGKIMMCDLDSQDEKVPLFTKFLVRGNEPKECCICAESYHDINFASEEEWVESCSGFNGKWMWQVLLFPTKMILDCKHMMKTCRSCLERNLVSDLEQHGRSGVGKLTCPQCNRLLKDTEIQLLATKETAEKFDRFQLLNLLSADPDFRWCLREGCQNGQLYEETAPDQEVVCEECSFKMCFRHQIPWHQGFTCDEYDSQQQHGDPNHGQTQEWLTTNTKKCPGNNCGVNVEKDGGCFHMTCRSCQHEFCWECLADWKEIQPVNGNYQQTAHKEGCFFRTNEVQPTHVAGNDIQAAIGRRNNH